MPTLTVLLTVAGIVGAYQLVLSLALSALPRRLGALVTRAPGLDIVVSLLTWAPWVAGAVYAGPAGFGGALLGQLVALGAWVMIHEWTHREALRGPRIVTFLNRTVGRFRNHAALWVTAVSLPVFFMIRAAEVFLYPFLVWLLGFPRYRHADWVNVSRQKFKNLVGHDLIWCLYCDWMTGVYSLGAEMLRNVESFWCPIRFASGVKCENCKLDFPDVARGWVPHDGTMADVERALEAHYGDGRREWFNHPARLTVEGEPLAAPAVAEGAGVNGTGTGVDGVEVKR